jgi:hypothetical protein
MLQLGAHRAIQDQERSGADAVVDRRHGGPAAALLSRP